MRSFVRNDSGPWLVVVGTMTLVLVGLLLLMPTQTTNKSGALAKSLDAGREPYEAFIPLAVSISPNPVVAGNTLTINATCTEYASDLERRRGEVTFGNLPAVPVPAGAWKTTETDVFEYDFVVPDDTAAADYDVFVRCFDREPPPPEPTFTPPLPTLSGHKVTVQVPAPTTTQPPPTTTTTTTQPPPGPTTTLPCADTGVIPCTE